MYKAVARPSLLYGTETWTTTKAISIRLAVNAGEFENASATESQYDQGMSGFRIRDEFESLDHDSSQVRGLQTAYHTLLRA